MGKIHTILRSHDDVLYKLEAWSKDCYIINIYYNEFKTVDEDAVVVSYECDSIVELYNLLKTDTSTTVDDIVGGLLRIRSSVDGKLCVIYKDKYSECFDDSTNSIIIKNTVESIYRKVMSVVPLVAYLDCFYGPIMNLMFKIYLNKKNGNKNSVDLVYLWYYIIKTGIVIPDFIQIPFNSVFLSVN